ncbi:MAG: hypothetical protein QGI86_19655 [Candidatus Poribacteria bacterium]|nr:hypothetical protein [Candidatus Poribacteria bacterium]MDP6748950.1 hypothetical protein [Candidatus Poribacteria bacterium]MDP6997578.1 hypothetical protein [Candidatus Poribacteria bacterium]
MQDVSLDRLPVKGQKVKGVGPSPLEVGVEAESKNQLGRPTGRRLPPDLGMI